MYDSSEFVDAYASEKDKHPFRIHMERHTVINLMNTISGMSVLDIACGTGNYSRLFCAHGAKKVIGVDSSGPMIDNAKRSTPKTLPIDFIEDFGENYRATEALDLVFHSYFLNYADSLYSLEKMCQSLHENLSKSGKMIGLISMLGKSPAGSVTCCDFHTSFEEPPKEGQRYKIHFKEQDEHIINFNWSQNTYSRCLQKNGFKNIKWHYPMKNNSTGLEKYQWLELKKFPVFLAVTASK